MNKLLNFRLGSLVVLAVLFSFGVLALVAYANNSWGGFHWARTANPFNLKLGDNVSGAWDSVLGTTSNDWSASSVLDTIIVAGAAKANCRPTKGRVEVCNKTYGANGWLGMASIWISGTHITQGTVKVNDTYFNTPTYNTPAWRNLVMCQEVGHTLGLDHQDENFDNPNLDTCMDYASNPESNQHPNQHDYDQLEAIYAHLDGFNSLSASVSGKNSNAPAFVSDIDTSNPSEWGKVIRRSADGQSSLYERDLGKGHKVFTFVIWAN